MAKIKGNILMKNVSGMLAGQVVVKHRNGVPYVCAPPTIDKTKPHSASRQAHLNKFAAASLYAKSACANPHTKTEYKAKASAREHAFHVAVKDSCNPPKVTKIATQGYRGNPGDLIFVQAEDDFKVERVRVEIISGEGVLIEEGEATMDEALWLYSATTRNENVTGSKIIATAFDRPKNVGKMEKVIG